MGGVVKGGVAGLPLLEERETEGVSSGKCLWVAGGLWF